MILENIILGKKKVGDFVKRYEKKFNVSLEDAIFFNPVNIAQHPEEIEEAIERLENSLKTGIPLNEDDIQLYNPDVIY